MERIKNLEELILRPDAVFGKIKKIDSKIILPGANESGVALDYTEIVAVGDKVEDLEPGDIVLDVANGVDAYTVDGVEYGLMYRGNIRIAVKKENFNKITKPNKTTLAS